GGRVDDGSGADFEFLALVVAHGGVPGDDVVTGFDRVPVQLLVGPGLVSRAPEPHPVGLLHLWPADQPLVCLAVAHAAPAGKSSLIDHPECGFDLHFGPPVAHATGAPSLARASATVEEPPHSS